MRIAILSLNPGHNYGGILQSYALKTVLERMGHEVTVISHERPMPPSFSIRYIPRYCIRLLRLLSNKSSVSVFAEYYAKKERKLIFQNTFAFCRQYLNLKFIKTFRDIKPDDFDAYVVGSDQVWRPVYFTAQFGAGIENAYLSFALSWKVKRIAYAPSFGVDKWEYTSEQTQHCAMLISHFDALSVREKSGVELCKKYLWREDAIQLCDPTILLAKADYVKLISPDTPQYDANLLVYCLDENEELNSLVSIVSNEKNLKPFNINFKKGLYYSIEERIKPSVESWIRAFQDAEFVITDSFHACVFSLIFHKPFLVIGNEKRGMSRFETLLNCFEQSQRLLHRADEYREGNVYPSLDNVDDIFSRLRTQSFQFLKDSL